MKEFKTQIGILQIEAYNDAITDVIYVIKAISESTETNTIITINELIEEINLLKIN